jgi:hypothetical protein
MYLTNFLWSLYTDGTVRKADGNHEFCLNLFDLVTTTAMFGITDTYEALFHMKRHGTYW